MASQQVRKTVTKRTYVSGSSSAASDTRGKSPTRLSRLEEKDQLTTLNDRLAAYIDHIRSLEQDNERLTLQVHTFEETSRREVDNVKALYEKELAAARRLVDEIAKENAKLSVNVGTYKSEAEEWMRKYSKKDRELSALQKKYSELEAQITDLEARLLAAEADKDRWQSEYGRIRGDIADLERQLASARKQLEEETLQKVDLENKVQSLKEELAFKSQLHQSEMNETRTRMEVSMEEVDTRAQREYEHKLEEALADFRKQHEEEMKRYRQEMEFMYEAKISGLQQELAQSDGMDEKVRIEISSYKSRISELQAQIAKLANQNASLESRIAALEADLASEREQSRALYDAKEREIRLLRDQLDSQMREYQDLLDIKVSLDLEIAAYRKLLEGEEERLNISRDLSQSEVKVTPKKRKRDEASSGGGAVTQQTKSSSGYSSSSQSSGALEVSEVDAEGRFIKVKNVSNKTVSLRDWSIVHKAGDMETDYKFHRSAKLAPGEEAAVWSADSTETHDPHNHVYVMKGKGWFIADNMTTTLNDGQKEVAVYEMSKSVQRTVLTGSRRIITSTGSEEMFHQRGDPEGQQSSCSIM